ncbi:MAG: hypothetical protein AAGI25_16650 [Bacteroidota bacterium]
MEQKTVIEEFRKLEEEFGPKKAQLLMDFVMKYSELLTRNLATKEDIHSVEANLLKTTKEDLHSVEKNLHSIEANLLKTTKEDLHSVEKNLHSIEANLLKTTKEDIHSVEKNLHSIEANLLKTMNRQVIWFASLLGGLATLFTIIIKYL